MPMKRLILIWVLLGLVLLAPPAPAQKCQGIHHKGAGILPHARTAKGAIVLLLGLQENRGWTCFGGGPQMVESLARPEPRCETPEETALREAHEEMRRLIPRTQLKSGLARAPFFPWAPAPGDFITFVVKIPPVDLSPFYTAMVPSRSPYAETQALAWIPLEELLRKAANPDYRVKTPDGRPLWEVFWEGIRPSLEDPGRVSALFSK